MFRQFIHMDACGGARNSLRRRTKSFAGFPARRALLSPRLWPGRNERRQCVSHNKILILQLERRYDRERGLALRIGVIRVAFRARTCMHIRSPGYYYPRPEGPRQSEEKSEEEESSWIVGHIYTYWYHQQVITYHVINMMIFQQFQFH